MLQLIDLSVGYPHPSPQILSNINMHVKKGEIHALVGLNGSGKTTLLKTAVGVLAPLQGQIKIAGSLLKLVSLKNRSRLISLLESQNQVVFPMTVKELLEISLRNHSNKKIYSAALEALDLETLENENLLELSSGEVKRAFIAHALCTDSEIILLDEPLAHLDWKHQARLVKSFKKWRENFGTTFVLAIHELEWVVRVADQTTALGSGGIIKNGSPQEVLESNEVSEVFAFKAHIDENPIDRTQRLTLGSRRDDQR